MFAFRESVPLDDHYLMDIDLKCFDRPWTPIEWRRVSKLCSILVATWNDKPIGMIVYGQTESGDFDVVKLGVKPVYRRQGIGSRLMLDAILAARNLMVPSIFVTVPESHVCPGDPYDVSAWLRKRSFRARLPNIKDHIELYGEWEDGVVFTLAVPLST